MNWLATKIGFGIIFANLIATLHIYLAGTPIPGIGITSGTMFAIPALLAVDWVRYALHCRRHDCWFE